MPKFLRTREYNLEQKCDQNLCVLLLFIAVVACDLNCIVRMVHAHPFWALTAFLVCFLSLAVGQIELTWVQNAPSKFTKEYILPEKQYTRCIMIIFSQGASCMYVRTYVCTYVCMFVGTYVRTYVRRYVCMYVRTYICTYVCYVCTYACMYVRTCVCVYVWMYVCM